MHAKVGSDGAEKVPEHVSEMWAALAIKARLSHHVLAEVTDPLPGSDLAADDAAYRWEKASAWLRQAVSAAVEHGILWANIVVPLQQFAGMEVRNPVRPYWTLARGGLEAAGQASWILNQDDRKVRVRRHLQLVYHDLRELETAMKAADDPQHHDIRTRMTTIGERVAGTYSFGSIKNDQPKYLTMLRDTAPSIGLTGDRLEVLWRAASAGAHGKNWFQLIGYHTEVGEEYEAGYFRTTLRIDVEQFTDMMTAAADMTQWAVLRFATRSGHQPSALYRRATQIVAEQTPVKPGCDIECAEFLSRLRAQEPASNS